MEFKSVNTIHQDSFVDDIKFFYNQIELNFDKVVTCSKNLTHSLLLEVDSSQRGIHILAKRSAKYVASIIATWHAGFYVVLLNTTWPKQKNLDINSRIDPCSNGW